MLPDDGERYLGAVERFLGAHGFDEEIYLWVRYEPPMCETEANFYEDVCESAGLTCAAVNRMFFSEGFYRTRQVRSLYSSNPVDKATSPHFVVLPYCSLQ